MKKLSTIATTCFAVSGLAMAQAPATAPAAPRTGLYTAVTKGNAAAENTVDRFSQRPTLIGDKQYFAGYGGANLGSAAFSFKGMGLNWFGQVTAATAPTPATLRFGAASGSAWGGGLLLAVDRTYTKTPSPSTETTTYYEASGIGVFGDFNLGNSDAYGQVGWNTGLPSVAGSQNSVLTKAPSPAPEDDDNNHTLSILLGWKKDATTEGTSALNLEFAYSSEMSKLENPSAKSTNQFFDLLPMYAYILKMNSDFSVFIGVNGDINFTQLEQGSGYALSASPNIAFQKQFGKGFEGFSGFSVTGSWAASSDIPADGAEASQLMTGGADVAVGLRWVKDNFAFEGSLNEVLLANGPYLVSGTPATAGMFGQVGISLGF